uniref:Uncharacterized protein n=1 Tax=Arundo donax TaxID=35708 RepID=A0A0A9BX68_ARUDO
MLCNKSGRIQGELCFCSSKLKHGMVVKSKRTMKN